MIALSEIGFAGAAFGIFIGWTPLNGMLAFTTVSSILVGELSGAVESRRESVISAISGLFIGLGILFLSLSNKNSSYATNILFGSVIGISHQEVVQMAALSVLVLVVLFFIFIPLHMYIKFAIFRFGHVKICLSRQVQIHLLLLSIHGIT